jgi:hypothetical protein
MDQPHCGLAAIDDRQSLERTDERHQSVRAVPSNTKSYSRWVFSAKKWLISTIGHVDLILVLHREG